MKQRSTMKLFPFHDCAKRAWEIHEQTGAYIYQQWICMHWGVKQTMPAANKFYIGGRCEECRQFTDIRHDGCNYMVVTSI